jgi:putative transposase
MRKKIDDKLKAQIALEAIRGDHTVNEIASRFNVHPNMVSKFKQHAIQSMPLLFSKKEDSRVKELESEREDLYKSIGEQKVAVDYLKKKCTQWGLL